MSSNRRKPKRSINPAFLAAHNRNDASVAVSVASSNSLNLFEKATDVALKTGKLSVPNNLISSREHLDRCFDLRASQTSKLEVDYSREDAGTKLWECHDEESLTYVDFSDNDLSFSSTSNEQVAACHLDGRIECYTHLKVLRAKRCNISRILSDMVFPSSLIILDLGGNRLDEFDLHMIPSGIQELHLSCNSVTSLVPKIKDEESSLSSRHHLVFPHLAVLDVSSNNIQEFPDALQTQSLRILNFGSNRVRKISSGLLSPALSAIEGANNLLADIPDLSEHEHLVLIELSNNQLVRTPCIGPKVTRVGLSSNSISSLKGLFPKWLILGEEAAPFRSSLVDFRINRNKLSNIDVDVVLAMTKLKFLDVSENDISNLPYALGYLPELQRICLTGNPLRTMRSTLSMDTETLKKSLRRRGPRPEGDGYLDQEVDDWRDASVSNDTNQFSITNRPPLLSTARSGASGTVNISDSKLDVLPTALLQEITENGQISRTISKLEMRNNILKDIDGEWILKLPNLSSLDAGKNKLASIFQGLGRSHLRTLILDQNHLTSEIISSSLFCSHMDEYNLVRSLSYLDLSSNRLEWIPVEIFSLSSLRTLLLRFNRIDLSKSGGKWHKGLQSLETLDLSNNCIRTLENFPQVARHDCLALKTLLLQNNEISIIPPELGFLQWLHHIDLRGNPQKSVRTSVLEKPCAEVLQYLRNRVSLKCGNAKEDREKEKVVCEISQNDTTRVPSNGVANDLRKKIDEISSELQANFGLSQAKKYALKKDLAMAKSRLIREERLQNQRG